MATRSFTDTYVITEEDVERFYSIMTNTDKIEIKEMPNYEDIKDEESLEFIKRIV